MIIRIIKVAIFFLIFKEIFSLNFTLFEIKFSFKSISFAPRLKKLSEYGINPLPKKPRLTYPVSTILHIFSVIDFIISSSFIFIIKSNNHNYN